MTAIYWTVALGVAIELEGDFLIRTISGLAWPLLLGIQIAERINAFSLTKKK